jgi:Ca-activated chloride channel family protein
LFCPSYTTAISKDPLSGDEEYWIAVGLNSGIKEADFTRNKQNLVVVMDISGSMSSSFDSYYYDGYGNYRTLDNSRDRGKSKMEIANETLTNLVDRLNPDDYFGIVLFDNNIQTFLPVTKVSDLDLKDLKNRILKIKERGGTDMSAGIDAGTELFENLETRNLP